MTIFGPDGREWSIRGPMLHRELQVSEVTGDRRTRPPGVTGMAEHSGINGGII
jgi:hypothetical protein